jgi:phospholipid/cholesterol/gamma-HCH transport system substrate-binding protein
MLSKEQRVGLFFIGALVLVGLAVELTVGTGVLRRGYPLYAVFRDTGGLDTGATVRVAGVKAGKVDAIELRLDGVRVRMRIDRGVVVSEGAVARLESQVLGGQRYVNIALAPLLASAEGTPSAVTPGTTLPSEEATSFSQLANQLGQVASSLDSFAQSFERNSSELLENVNALVEENRNAVTRTLANLDAISTGIAEGKGSLGKLAQDPALYDEAKESLAAMRESFGNMSIATGKLARGEGTLGKLLHDDGLYTQAEEAIASLNRTADTIEDISADLRQGEGTLGKMLTDDSLYREAQDAVRTVQRATQGVEDQAPISVLSTFASSLF